MATSRTVKCVVVAAHAVVIFLTVYVLYIFQLQPLHTFSVYRLKSREGGRISMVVSFSYWEQTANALKNLADLQCWASTLNISTVVEPAIYSTPGNVFHFSTRPNITFRDYFDLSLWNSLSRNINYSKLVPVKTFFEKAHKNMLYIQLLIGRKKDACQTEEQLFKTTWMQDLKTHGFNIKIACVFQDSSIEDSSFREMVLSSYGSNKISILFNEWRGINEKLNYRLKLKGSTCQRSYSGLAAQLSALGNPVLFSKKLVAHRDYFIRKFIHNKKYVVIMVRTEKLDFAKSTFPKFNETSCIQDIVGDRNGAAELSNSFTTLYFTDFGEHGSSAWSYKWRTKSSAKNFSKHLEEALNPTYTSGELISHLESITKSKDSILIAMLQSLLAARAEVLILVGGGSFQSQTLSMYLHAHKKHKHYGRNSLCA